MPHQTDPSTLVDGVLAAAAHLEPELEEALSSTTSHARASRSSRPCSPPKVTP